MHANVTPYKTCIFVGFRESVLWMQDFWVPEPRLRVEGLSSGDRLLGLETGCWNSILGI